MNRVVVTRAAAGLAAYLVTRTSAMARSVVIGYDARHNSDVFARDTAEVMTGAGLQALVLPRPLPTPVLAFAIRELGCAAGVMVTASHNPPQDNGYKVYLGDGSQIVPPADVEIAEQIAAVGAMAEVPRGDAGTVLSEEIVDSYLDTVAGLVGDGPRDLTTVYTPLHGVGGTSVIQVLETAGFEPPHVVTHQEEPDPEFPTVAFPNPEEPGAMDLAMALADETGADLVVANDPDADRCAAAVPGPHGWRMLRGDEVGALLAHHLLGAGKEGVYATSIVSSSLLGKMAAAAGQPYAETLTGFKWIGRLDGLAFGYEEALGYCVDPEHVRDKDGVSALLLLCEVAAAAKAAGRTLDDLLDDIATEHGLHATDQLSVRVTDLARDRRGDGAPARRLRPRSSAVSRSRGSTIWRRGPTPAADRWPALPPGRGRPRDRAAERDRAQDQVLPRGGRARATRTMVWTRPGSPRSAGSTRCATTSSAPPGSDPLAAAHCPSAWPNLCPSPCPVAASYAATAFFVAVIRQASARISNTSCSSALGKGDRHPRRRPRRPPLREGAGVGGDHRLPLVVGRLDHRGVVDVVDPAEALAAEGDRCPLPILLQHHVWELLGEGDDLGRVHAPILDQAADIDERGQTATDTTKPTALMARAATSGHAQARCTWSARATCSSEYRLIPACARASSARWWIRVSTNSP